MINVQKLNKSMSPKIVEARIAHILNSYDRVLITSSFGTTSAILLHLISRIKQQYPIYFINTHYLFNETIEYKNRLQKHLGLNVVELQPEDWKHQFTEEDKTWEKDPDFCCHVNKVEPLNEVLDKHKVWISGLIGYQNRYRSSLDIIDKRSNIYKMYPLIDWTPKMVNDYFEMHGLPRHPLEKKGYASLGCVQCTSKSGGREGRWSGSSKTECGLHKH